MNISNKKILRGGEYIELAPAIYRTATALELRGSFVGKTASVAIQIQHFVSEERVEKEPMMEDGVVSLLIDNNTLIDSRDGSYADETTPEEFVKGEFDFFLTQTLASIEDMLNMSILRADVINRFD